MQFYPGGIPTVFFFNLKFSVTQLLNTSSQNSVPPNDPKVSVPSASVPRTKLH